jgi:hypothetical protein
MENLLSSMPLCFNIFGALRGRLALADLIRVVFEVNAELVEVCECEWRPYSSGLDDRTAFDAFIAYVTPNGARRFIGIETKYTEPFSTTVYGSREPAASRYRKVTEQSGWFHPGASDVLATKQTDQLWRNTMLAASMCHGAAEWDDGSVVVLHLDADKRARDAVKLVRAQLSDSGRLSAVTFEKLVLTAKTIPDLVEWAGAFERRYLGPSPALSEAASV